MSVLVFLLAFFLDFFELAFIIVPLLAPAERTQILAEWNATELPQPPDACLDELFAAQVARTRATCPAGPAWP